MGTTTVLAYVISTSTATTNGLDPVISSAVINALGFIAAGFLGASLAYRSTKQQNASEDLRLKQTLAAEAARAENQRLFEARRAVYTETFYVFSTRTIRRTDGHEVMDEGEREAVRRALSALLLVAPEDLSAACRVLFGLFQKPHDRDAELEATRTIVNLMKRDLGVG